ncbi:MAG: (Fe-S)-binding protein [Nitrosomonas sp. PRO4]|nr:(Fe-S)-binding protein [Nitrosomonas sp. PRO4]
MSPKFSEKRILVKSNQCVSCGLCLPHCPTYRLLKSEADSPRGRIALMNGVVNERIPLNDKFIQHMDRCLTCRACERVCPNRVEFGNLIDEARTLIANQSKFFSSNQNSVIKVLLKKLLLVKPARLELLRQFLSFLQKRRIFNWLLAFPLSKKNNLLEFISRLPSVEFPYIKAVDGKYVKSNSWGKVYLSQVQERGKVGLFLGCIARITDAATLNASIYVLNCLGYSVHIPSNQTCCGAIHQHSGELDLAASLTMQNKIAFEEAGLNIIITTSSGCSLQLLESEADMNTNSIIDINRFLATAEGWESVQIEPLLQKIFVHDPCSLRNVSGDQAYPYELISRIPGVQAIPLTNNDQCCGAAGTYFLDQPELAGMLLDEKIISITESGTKYIVTSNIGCAMHIACGLYKKNIDIEVLHPVTLLARQMGWKL